MSDDHRGFAALVRRREVWLGPGATLVTVTGQPYGQQAWALYEDLILSGGLMTSHANLSRLPNGSAIVGLELTREAEARFLAHEPPALGGTLNPTIRVERADEAPIGEATTHGT